ncbi:ATP:cob(I)alamin adenosyltransferase [Candidatus Izimaplasma bacterium ZiA1]|uniref:cob(I)yrinic acid a,c-diamide adenosyltransferase n=1 Tax=Candidatus Izimoplasma sp. ZiA1 TaxID=2024899 RepID=UPI000BAA6B88|nr:ATP:cob(I)alamin adenosyltransferase [Candidatus Izimaplasma bacterium ZiA1]
MKKITKQAIVSTKNGDKGYSRNYSNEKIIKSDILFETLGTIDELSSNLGLTYHQAGMLKEIKLIQAVLQDVNSVIATNPNSDNYLKLNLVNSEDVKQLENIEQDLLDKYPIEPRFVLPGSDTSLVGAYFDICRSIARRAERCVVRFEEQYNRSDLEYIKRYLNRLSDLLFIYARSLEKK